MSARKVVSLVCLIVIPGILARADAVPEQPSAAQILSSTGIKGGLVVHLGCGSGRLTAALRAHDGFVVHGLERDPQQVAAARAYVQSLGLYGPVFIEQWTDKHLPYIDNSVNLVIAEDPGSVTSSEIMRVLVPLGVAYIKAGETWTQQVKAWPREIDEWTHYLHDPTNNAVAHDSPAYDHGPGRALGPSALGAGYELGVPVPGSGPAAGVVPRWRAYPMS